MKKILLVDDEFIITALLERQLRKLGHEVTASVATGEEAVESVRNTEPDLVLMDIKIRGTLNGIETMHAIRSFSNVPVIYLTGNSDSVTLDEARSTEPAGFLIKPFDIHALKDALAAVFENNGDPSER